MDVPDRTHFQIGLGRFRVERTAFQAVLGRTERTGLRVISEQTTQYTQPANNVGITITIRRKGRRNLRTRRRSEQQVVNDFARTLGQAPFSLASAMQRARVRGEREQVGMTRVPVGIYRQHLVMTLVVSRGSPTLVVLGNFHVLLLG